MTEEQGERMLGYLALILGELEGLRSDFQEFQGFGTQRMGDVAEAITGPTGYHLGDLHGKLSDLEIALTGIETAIELKC